MSILTAPREGRPIPASQGVTKGERGPRVGRQHEGSEEPMDPAGWTSGKAASGSTAEWEQHPPVSGQGPVLSRSLRMGSAVCSQQHLSLLSLHPTSFSLHLADQKALLGPKQGQSVGASLTGTLLPVQAGFYVLGMYPLDSQLHDLCDHPSFKLWFFSLCPSAFWAHPVTSYRKPPDAQSMLDSLALGWHLIP